MSSRTSSSVVTELLSRLNSRSSSPSKKSFAFEGTIAGNRRGNVKSNTDSLRADSFGRRSSSPLCALHNAPST
eukprot:5696247-Pleurochrysis_carterae.AAC.2